MDRRRRHICTILLRSSVRPSKMDTLNTDIEYHSTETRAKITEMQPDMARSTVAWMLCYGVLCHNGVLCSL